MMEARAGGSVVASGPMGGARRAGTAAGAESVAAGAGAGVALAKGPSELGAVGAAVAGAPTAVADPSDTLDLLRHPG